MMRLGIVFFTLAFAGSFAPTPTLVKSDQQSASHTQETKDTEADRRLRKARWLLRENGLRESQVRMIEATLNEYKDTPLIMEGMKKRLDIDVIFEFTAAIYAEKLDESTIDALTTFYGSAEGLKFAKASPTSPKKR